MGGEDEKEVIKYFTGVTNECQQIDPTLRAQLLIPKSSLRTGKIAPVETGSKKRELKAEEKEKKLEVSDYVLLNEKKIQSRSTVL